MQIVELPEKTDHCLTHKLDQAMEDPQPPALSLDHTLCKPFPLWGLFQEHSLERALWKLSGLYM